MITVHIDGIWLGNTYETSFRQSHSFAFDGQDDAATTQSIIEKYNQMVADGFINVCCVNEDSQVPEDSALSHLRYSAPYSYKGQNSAKFIPDYSADELIDIFDD